MKLKKEDWEAFTFLICKATNKDLKTMLRLVENEVRLSEISIKEGFEKRK